MQRRRVVLACSLVATVSILGLTRARTPEPAPAVLVASHGAERITMIQPGQGVSMRSGREEIIDLTTGEPVAYQVINLRTDEIVTVTPP